VIRETAPLRETKIVSGLSRFCFIFVRFIRFIRFILPNPLMALGLLQQSRET